MTLATEKPAPSCSYAHAQWACVTTDKMHGISIYSWHVNRQRAEYNAGLTGGRVESAAGALETVANQFRGPSPHQLLARVGLQVPKRWGDVCVDGMVTIQISTELIGDIQELLERWR